MHTAYDVHAFSTLTPLSGLQEGYSACETRSRPTGMQVVWYGSV